MSPACQQAANGAGFGLADSLRAVDCAAQEMTGEVFGRLFAPGGAMVPVLISLLTIFVAVYAILLMLGRTNIGLRALVPRMFTLGLVLTFATSWAAYQAVVWNLAIASPDWLAGVMTGAEGSATMSFAGKLQQVFLAIQQVDSNQQNSAEAAAQNASAFSPSGLMWLGAMLMLLGSVGVLVTARIALAVLIAIGPIFVVMALFTGTRGLFTGWLKGVVMMAITPIFAVLGGGIMLELSVPVIRALQASPGEINAQAAVAFFMIGAVEVALMIMVLKVTGTMVAGWRVFGLVPDRAEAADVAAANAEGGRLAYSQMSNMRGIQEAQADAASNSRVGAMTRQISLGGASPGMPANDMTASHGGRRDTKIINNSVTAASSNEAKGSAMHARPRAQGVGSRFRAPQPKREKFT